MARRGTVGKPETRLAALGRRFPDAFGEAGIGAGWIVIGILGIAFLAVASALLSVGAPEPLLAVGPIMLVLALACAVVRMVRIDPEAGEVLVTRRLLGRAWTRRRRLDGFGRVVVRFDIARPRRSIHPDTLAGNQVHGYYDVRLERPGSLKIASFHAASGVPEAREAAERLALALAARMGVPAERQGWRPVAQGDGSTLSEPRRRHAEPIAGDRVIAAGELAALLAAFGNGAGER